jgi:alpha-1,3-rhamnosyl/mannosyltransferase
LRGWENSALDKLLYPLVQSGDVRVLGYVPDEHLPAMYSGATAFVYPSLYEGFGLPPLEAMACGTPVIASNRASLPEVVGDAGITIGAYDIEGLCAAMHELACDPKKRQVLAESGLQRSRHFSWRRTAAETINVYKSVQQASR